MNRMPDSGPRPWTITHKKHRRSHRRHALGDVVVQSSQRNTSLTAAQGRGKDKAIDQAFAYKQDQILVGGFNPSEKYESQWEGLSHILWKIKNVANHQPE